MGERLDVVHQRRVGLALGATGGGLVDGLPAGLDVGGEQAVLVGRQQAGERIVALDHLEQRLLLAEEVLVGPEHEVDREVGEQPAPRRPRRWRSASALGLPLVARLGGDVGGLGPDRERGDGQPFEHPVRIVAQQRPVLERARLTLGGVAHREPPARPRLADARPLPPGREPAAASPPQPAVGDLADDGVLADLHRRRERLAAAARAGTRPARRPAHRPAAPAPCLRGYGGPTPVPTSVVDLVRHATFAADVGLRGGRCRGCRSSPCGAPRRGAGGGGRWRPRGGRRRPRRGLGGGRRCARPR